MKEVELEQELVKIKLKEEYELKITSLKEDKEAREKMEKMEEIAQLNQREEEAEKVINVRIEEEKE